MTDKKSTLKRIPEVDLLRGFAAICVIVGHSFITTPIDISGVSWCQQLYRIINSFHMEVFFVLAGFVYHCTSYKKYISGKIQRILVPYFFFGVLALLLHSFGGEAVNRHTPFLEGIQNLILYGGSYWFLYTMFIILAVFPFVERFLNMQYKMVIFAILLVVMQLIVRFPNLATINSIVYYFPYFILGYLLRKHYDEIKEKVTSKTIIGLLALISAIIFIVSYLFISKGALANYATGIAGFVFFSMIALSIIAINPKILENSWLGGVLRQCSQFSLQIYLFNGFILVPIRILLCRVLHITSPVIIVLAITVIDLTITLTLCNYVIPKLKIVAKLCGIKEAKA